MLIGEMLIGKTTQLNPVDALRTLAKKQQSSTAWQYLGWFGAITLLLILSFYSIVAGWICSHTLDVIISGKDALIQSSSKQNTLFEQPIRMMLCTLTFLLFTGLMVGKGLHKGLERLSLFLMPLLLFGLLILSLSHVYTKGFVDTFQFMFAIKWHAISAQTCLAALGHAFFTLAIGAGAMLTYGSYLSNKTHLPSAATIIALLNLLCALLSGFAFFPILFNAGMSVSSGTTLMFDALPRAIMHWPHAALVGALFYFLLLAAAVTSSVSLVEPWVALLEKRTKKRRIFIALGTCLVGFIIGIPPTLSLTYPTLGYNQISLFDNIIAMVSQILLPVGALMFTIFAGWLVPKNDWTQLTKSSWTSAYLYQCCRYIAPLAICVSLVGVIL